jgi:amino acid permease
MMPDPDTPLPWANTLYCYFISIAVIIGTGILAIPVKLYDTGFVPFALPFTVTMLTQVALVFFTTELLQSADPAFKGDALDSAASKDIIPLEALKKSDAEPAQHGEESAGHAVLRKEIDSTSSLYQIGMQFLSPFWRPVFSLCTVAHLSAMLVTYALAGSKSSCQVR